MEDLFQVKQRLPTPRQTTARQMRMPLWLGSIFIPLLVIIACLWTPRAEAAPAANESAPAQLKISGYGWLGNRELKRRLNFILPNKTTSFYGADFIEDAALLLVSAVQRDGYLQPQIIGTVTLADGTKKQFQWDKDLDTLVPHPLEAKRVHFRIKRGVRYYFKRLEFSGLELMSAKKAKSYFVESGALPLRGSSVFTPARLQRGISALTEELVRNGFAEALIKVAQLDRNDINGGVHVHIAVNQGLRSFVRSVKTEYFSPGETQPYKSAVILTQAIYSPIWVQDFAQRLRTNQYHFGYPDAKVGYSIAERHVQATNIDLELQTRIDTGPEVTLGSVRFTGK